MLQDFDILLQKVDYFIKIFYRFKETVLFQYFPILPLHFCYCRVCCVPHTYIVFNDLSRSPLRRVYIVQSQMNLIITSYARIKPILKTDFYVLIIMSNVF